MKKAFDWYFYNLTGLGRVLRKFEKYIQERYEMEG